MLHWYTSLKSFLQKTVILDANKSAILLIYLTISVPG
uniref:Uncharacterized protein n=1 Tax=Tetranychus urticae TaxID=32264 RepID=T1KUA3_TETUR